MKGTSSRMEVEKDASLNESAVVLQTKVLYEQFGKTINKSEYFKQLVKGNHTHRHVLRFFGNLALFGTLLGIELTLFKSYSLLSAIAFPAYVYLQGSVIFAFMVHSHELSHDHIKTNWLNDTLGVISGSFIWVNFYSFQYAHRFHHINIGNLDSPEIGAPVSLKGQKHLGKRDIHQMLLQTFLRSKFIAYLITWPLHLYYGDYASWALPFRTKGRIHSKSLACFLGLVTLNAVLLIHFGLSYLFLYVAPVFLAGVGILMLTFLHHAHEDLLFFSEEHHSRNASMMFTTDRDYGLLGNFFMLNNGFHITHHLNPMIAYYDLKSASRYLRNELPAQLKYNYYENSKLYRDFVDGIYEQRLNHNPDFYRLNYLNSGK